MKKKEVFTWLNGAWRRFYPLTTRCLSLHSPPNEIYHFCTGVLIMKLRKYCVVTLTHIICLFILGFWSPSESGWNPLGGGTKSQLFRAASGLWFMWYYFQSVAVQLKTDQQTPLICLMKPGWFMQLLDEVNNEEALEAELEKQEKCFLIQFSKHYIWGGFFLPVELIWCKFN